MDYLARFKEKDFPWRKNPFAFTVYHPEDRVFFPESGRVVIIAVLEGSVDLYFPAYYQRVENGYLTVLDRNTLVRGVCNKDSFLLEYTPSDQLVYYLDKCHFAFHKPCLSNIPIRPDLKQWIDSLITSFENDPSDLSQPQSQAMRKKLAELMLNYPQELLEELYVALTACYKIFKP